MRTDIDSIGLTFKYYTNLVECIEQPDVADECWEKVLHLHSEVPQSSLFQSLSGRSPQDQALQERKLSSGEIAMVHISES